MNSIANFNFKKKLTEYLRIKKWSIDLFATKCDMSRTTIHNLFKTNNLSLNQLHKFSEILEIDAFDWFADNIQYDNVVKENNVSYIKADFKEFNNSNINIGLDQCRHKVELLEKEVEGLNKEIILKNEIIDLLKKAK